MVSPLAAVLMQVAKAPAVPALHVAASLTVGQSDANCRAHDRGTRKERAADARALAQQMRVFHTATNLAKCAHRRPPCFSPQVPRYKRPCCPL